jgi:uncharacterized protein
VHLFLNTYKVFLPKFFVLKGYLSDKSPSFHFAALMVLWFLSFNIIRFMMAGALVLYYGPENYQQLADNLMSGNINNNLLKGMQIASSLGMFLLPVLIFYYMKEENPLYSLQLDISPKIVLLFLVVAIVIFSAPFIITITELNQKMQLPSYLSSLEQFLKDTEAQSESMLKRLLLMDTRFDFALNFLMLAIMPALCEEFFFRGCLQPILTRLYGNILFATHDYGHGAGLYVCMDRQPVVSDGGAPVSQRLAGGGVISVSAEGDYLRSGNGCFARAAFCIG